jgi:hypothetical protein
VTTIADRLGVYTGASAVRTVRLFEQGLLRRPLYLASDHTAGDDWTKPMQAFSTTQAWLGNTIVPGYSSDYATRMHYSLPILATKNNNTGSGADDGSKATTLARGAFGASPTDDGSYASSGAYNAYWKDYAEKLVAAGAANAIIRLGWEFNLTTTPTPHRNWTINGTGANSVDDAANFAQYFRNIVTAMRSAAGQDFLFDWCTVNGYNSAKNPETAYPGDAYVDFITQDVYDRNFDTGFADPDVRWLNILGQRRKADGSAGDGQGRRWGLEWCRAFARSRGKPFAIPEWGVWYEPASPQAGGDNPDFITKMYDWMSGNAIGDGAGELAFAIYFNFGANKLNRADLALVESMREFQRLFAPVPPVPRRFRFF